MVASVDYEERTSHFSLLMNDAMDGQPNQMMPVSQSYAYRAVTEFDDFDTEILNGLSSSQKTYNLSVAEEESKTPPTAVKQQLIGAAHYSVQSDLKAKEITKEQV